MNLNHRVLKLAFAYAKGLHPQIIQSDGAIEALDTWARDENRDLANLDNETWEALLATVWTVAHNASDAAIIAHSHVITTQHAEDAIGNFSTFSNSGACNP